MFLNPNAAYAEKRKRALHLAAVFIFTFLVMVTLLRAISQTLFFTVRVDGSSMNPILQNGNVVGVNRLAEIQRGSIVVAQTQSGTSIVKRVIALPGETVWSVQGRVYISGPHGNLTLTEDYVLPENAGGQDVPRTEVPSGNVFLLGDNRAVSLDSRSFGPVPIENVMGVVTEFWLSHKFS